MKEEVVVIEKRELPNGWKMQRLEHLITMKKGKANKVAEPYFEGRCSTELIPILPKSTCKRDYLAMLLRSSQTIQAAIKNKTGSRMPRADMTEIMKLKIKLPDMNEQESILQKMKLFTSQLDEIRSTIKIQLNAINQLPASILNEVFGQYQIK